MHTLSDKVIRDVIVGVVGVEIFVLDIDKEVLGRLSVRIAKTVVVAYLAKKH